MEYYSTTKKNEITPFAVTWMDLEINILNKPKRQRSYDITYMCILKIWHKWTYLQNRNKLTDIENRSVVAMGEEWWIGSLGLVDVKYYIINRMDKQQGYYMALRTTLSTI